VRDKRAGKRKRQFSVVRDLPRLNMKGPSPDDFSQSIGKLPSDILGPRKLDGGTERVTHELAEEYSSRSIPNGG
jgi:hypothetical protein